MNLISGDDKDFVPELSSYEADMLELRPSSWIRPYTWVTEQATHYDVRAQWISITYSDTRWIQSFRWVNQLQPMNSDQSGNIINARIWSQSMNISQAKMNIEQDSNMWWL